MITVTYLPSGEFSPLPDSTRNEYSFHSHEDFKKWVQSYVCSHCLVSFIDWYGRKPVTLHDWMHGGCGCEIDVNDENDLIDWNDKMEVSFDLEEKLEEHLNILVDAFQRHG